jgi:hypothetical protein
MRAIFFKNAKGLSKESIKIFSKAINKIQEDLNKEGIPYFPVLLSPYAEIKNGTAKSTHKDLNGIFNGTLLMPSYGGYKFESFFYPLDGHFTESLN